MDSVFIVMPAYNEQENIEEVVTSWYSMLDGKSDESRLVIADSGSSDNTHAILKNMMDIYPKIVVLSNTNRYHGPKVLSLYKYAISQKADYVFQTDSDGQTNPKEFDDFWILRNEYDAIIGNRVIRGDGRIRKILENIVCKLLNLYYGIKVPDANAPFRLMRAAVVEKYLPVMPEDFNLPNAVLAACFKRFHEKVTYRVITFKPRQGGVNSINMKKIFKIGWKALGDFRKINANLKKL